MYSAHEGREDATRIYCREGLQGNGRKADDFRQQGNPRFKTPLKRNSSRERRRINIAWHQETLKKKKKHAMERDKKSKWAHEGIAGGVTTLEQKPGRSISACNASRNRKQNATRIKKREMGR